MSQKYTWILAMCCAVVAGGCATTKHNSSATQNVSGTTWVGTESGEHRYEYIFLHAAILPGIRTPFRGNHGILHYTSPYGSYKNGTWQQDGDSIQMETNKGFSTRIGTISENHMIGRAWNKRGERWDWQAERQ